jgi:ABC-type multidrug transport system fused ATPase/permease subunit
MPDPVAEASVYSLARRFFPFVAAKRLTAILTVGLVLSSPLVAGALLWMLKRLVDEVLIAGRLDRLAPFIVAYLAIIGCKLALDYAVEVLEASVVEQVVRGIRTTLYAHLLSLSPGSLAKHSHGALLSQLGGDVERTEHLVYTGPLAIFADAASAAFFLGFLFLMSWKLTLCAFLVLPLLVLASLLLSPRIRRASRVARWRAAGWLSLAEDRLGALPVVRAFGAIAREARAFGWRCTKARQAELRTVAIQASLTVIIEAVAALGGLLVLVLGAHEIKDGTLTVGTLVAFLGSVGSLYGPAAGLAKATGRVQRAAAAAQRVADLLDTPSLVREQESVTTLAPVRGALEFCDVAFAYPAGPQVLHRVSLQVEPGEMVAVVGPSGSGKSTLLALALRFYDPTEGAVLVDGTDLRQVALASLVRLFAPVFQDPHIVSGSLLENMRYGRPEVSQQQVLDIAQAVHADAVIASSPRGLAGPVGPRGSGLSGGQRQRVALVRALLQEAPILLLDEATAAVDSETEELIQGAILRYRGQRTIVLVAHRLSSVRRADRIVVLEGGRIVESGTPQSLLATASRCRQLFEAQFERTHRAA